MEKIKHLVFGLSLLLIASCSKESESASDENNFLIFGHYYGECMGETCVETFKLTSNKLYEDTNDNYSGTDFSFSQLSSSTFAEVSDLNDYFPNELLSASESTFGCPDCLDQGGMLIQYAVDGNVQTWRIDQFQNSVPEYLHEFMDKVNLSIILIND